MLDDRPHSYKEKLMKKILAILAVAISGTAFAADSVTVESQRINNAGAAAQQQYVLGVKKEFSGFAGDLAFSNAQTEGTNALSTRIEAGATVAGPVGLYARVATGQKYSNTADFSYYSIEPGIAVAVPGVAGLTAKAGFRWRSAYDSANNDQTHTARYSLAYAVSKIDTVAVKYDRVNGDSNQKIVSVAYTRGF
jgi:hypothetical protein